ncbi:DUF4136 domain-containing protein [Sulfurovum riftiae]|uniref:DUF4136 domain-containing protein n=1 Tax=Sulfurovum riftiae TaxID=1630136 RepID=A0A151CJH9_9BACT|nr:DUF4136 domain-containing protein [Sulfurovum riftiae]KYJ87647.1 hypothetical protein AS592_11175 [Sulfurovum riftiae]
MTNILKVSLVALVFAGVTGCGVSTKDIEVETVKSEKANLKGYKTYEIIKESGADDSLKKDKTLKGVDVDADIKKIITAELAKRGKTEVTHDPDFFVAYVAGADMNAMKIKLDDKGRSTIENIPEAAMLLMLVDADTGSIIWLSTAEAEFKGLPLEQQQERLKYTIKKMLSGL